MSLRLEAFADEHPHLDAHGFVKAGRAALSRFHDSPIALLIEVDGESKTEELHFAPADASRIFPYQRRRIVEDGAIAIAGLLLRELHGYCIVDVVPHGSRADYFIGPGPSGERIGLVEVSGTDEEDLERRVAEKAASLRESPYLAADSRWAAFVAVTRFCEPRSVCRSLENRGDDG